jgi:hypothetical protein
MLKYFLISGYVTTEYKTKTTNAIQIGSLSLYNTPTLASVDTSIDPGANPLIALVSPMYCVNGETRK